MKTKNLIILLVTFLAIAGFFLMNKKAKSASSKEITFYYLPDCPWCQQIEKDGTLEKVEQLGIKVNRIDASIGPIRHKFESVPTLVINEKIYSGYRAFEEIKTLLEENNQISSSTPFQEEFSFSGEKGENVVLENEEIKIPVFNDDKARFYNVSYSDSKTIYFFVVKDKNGIYRAAANACQVCFSVRKGFHQEGNEIVCNNCGNRYPIEKLATEKGGCNPGPINPNLEVKNGEVVIKKADIEQVSEFF